MNELLEIESERERGRKRERERGDMGSVWLKQEVYCLYWKC